MPLYTVYESGEEGLLQTIEYKASHSDASSYAGETSYSYGGKTQITTENGTYLVNGAFGSGTCILFGNISDDSSYVTVSLGAGGGGAHKAAVSATAYYLCAE